MSSVDILAIRRRLGRKDWIRPTMFGPDGWMLFHRDGAKIIVSAGPAPDNGHDVSDWLHASIGRPDRMPDYEDLTMLHKAVWPDGYAYQVFAPPAAHINIHPHVLHLWGRPDGQRQLPEFGALGTI